MSRRKDKAEVLIRLFRPPVEIIGERTHFWGYHIPLICPDEPFIIVSGVVGTTDDDAPDIGFNTGLIKVVCHLDVGEFILKTATFEGTMDDCINTFKMVSVCVSVGAGQFSNLNAFNLFSLSIRGFHVQQNEFIALAKFWKHPSSDIAGTSGDKDSFTVWHLRMFPSRIIEVYQEVVVVLLFFDFVHVVFLGLHFLDEKIVDLTQETVIASLYSQGHLGTPRLAMSSAWLCAVRPVVTGYPPGDHSGTGDRNPQADRVR